MEDVDRAELLMTIQAKINQVEMLRQRGVDVSRATVFYNWENEDGSAEQSILELDEEHIFPEWFDLIRLEPDVQDSVIQSFSQNYTLLTGDGQFILNTKYPSTRYRELDPRTKEPLDHLYVFYPFKNKVGKIPPNDLKSIVTEFYGDVERNIKSIGRQVVLDDVIVLLLTDNKVTIPSELKQNYGKRIQVMYHDQIYPFTHILHSRHVKLDEKEANEVLNEASVKRAQLPRLYENEPVCRYYGWYPGNIIRIFRKASGIPTFIRQTVTEAVVVSGDPPYPKQHSKIIY